MELILFVFVIFIAFFSVGMPVAVIVHKIRNRRRVPVESKYDIDCSL